MRLKAAVLEVVRGAAGATLLVAVGCSGSESSAREPAGPIAPPRVVARPPAEVAVPAPPREVAAPAGKPTEAPSVVFAPVAPPATPIDDAVLVGRDPRLPDVHADPGAPPANERGRRGRRRRRGDHALEPLARPLHMPPDIAAACGRG
jgi:hypothetical protein